MIQTLLYAPASGFSESDFSWRLLNRKEQRVSLAKLSRGAWSVYRHNSLYAHLCILVERIFALQEIDCNFL